MNFGNLKKAFAVSTLGVVAILGVSGTANAQRNNNNKNQQKKVVKQNQKIEKQQQKIDSQKSRIQQQQAQLARQRELQRQQQIRLEQERQARLRAQQQNRRYRVYRNGGYYQTDYRGAELLRQAVNRGYQQGFEAGKYDRSSRRNYSYNNSSIYRNGNYGYQSYVDSRQYQYYFK